MSAHAKKRRRERLFAANPNCHWCGRKTRLIVPKRHQTLPDDAATIDHLRSRFDPTRRDPNPLREERTVLACYKCNQVRARLEQEAQPIDVRRQRYKNRDKFHLGPKRPGWVPLGSGTEDE